MTSSRRLAAISISADADWWCRSYPWDRGRSPRGSETAALRGAVENGKVQAEQLAEVLGVELGELTLASRQPSYGAYGGQPGGACVEPLTVEAVKAGTVYLPPFNAAVDPEFEIYATVLLTYAIG
jgi:hypothetical protein